MKKIIFTLLLVSGIALGLKAQVVNFSDNVFKSILLNDASINTNNDDEIQLSEARAATRVLASNDYVTSVSGLEYFENLERLTLNCDNLTSIDLSHFPDLVYFGMNANLSEADLSDNPKLNWVVLGQNQLNSLDVSHNPELERLHVGGNQLTSLDVSSNPKLKMLTLNNNQVTSLDVSDNPLITTLECYNNNLSALDLSNNADLQVLWCERNNLSTLDLTNNTKLLTVKCYSNELTEIDVSNCPDLNDIECGNNQITSLQFHPNLRMLDCSNNRLSSLDASQNEGLSSLICSGNPDLKEICVYSKSRAESGELFIKDAGASWVENCNVVTGRQSFNLPATPAIYPNPAKDIVYFGDKAVNVIIYNSVGEKVIKGKFKSVNLGRFPAGVYQVYLIDSDKRARVEKLIKE